MPMTPGTRLGPYEILAPLGAGGMGEVYRARDSRLDRVVAVKVLSPQLAGAPEARARFEREARAVSALNHPHVCALYDIGTQGDLIYLVMEHLEGETLALRLERGALPVAELLARGTEIADALDRAHRAGIVHRDLKPGNIMMTKSGAKLMDFGLARGGPAAGGSRLAAATGEDSGSPTWSQPLTAEGTIVGTFQYMAPEVLEGREADARSDLWALGCVLYEMATAKKAFQGRSQASLISAILSAEPPALTTLAPDPASPGAPPPALEQLVQACLAKDPDERVQTAHDVKLELGWIAQGSSRAGVSAVVARRRRVRERLAWILAAGATAVAIVTAGALLLRPSEPPRVVRFEVHPPREATDVQWPRLSPDGRTLAFLAPDSAGVPRLWIRPLAAVEAHPLDAIVENPRPFWSPDSRYLAFIAEGKLRKVPLTGGPAIDICDAPGGSDGTWGKRGWILFDGGIGDSIQGVPAAGGAPRAVTFIDRAHGERSHAWPFFLPDGRRFLYVASRTGGPDALCMGTLGSKRSRVVGVTESRAEYALPGYLVHVSGANLVAQPFDAGSARTTGDPVPIGEIVAGSYGLFSVSSTGVLAYRPRTSHWQSRLSWIARDGHILGEAAPPGFYESVALSPDGRRLALSIVAAQPPTRDIWVRDLARGVNSRVTFDPGDEIAPVWSPDGNRIAFSGNHSGAFRCYLKAANGVGAEDSVPHTQGSYEGPTDWSGAANTLVISHVTLPYQWDIWVAPASGGQAPRPFLQSPFGEYAGRLSPDGRWLAYASNESGRDEVYVVPYPGPGGKWQISTAGGNFPRWRADGKELFFQGAGEEIMAVDVRAGTTFQVGAPKLLFRTRLTQGAYPGDRWNVTRDGQRFLVDTPFGAAAAGYFVVVENWTTELRRK
jgi:eukaryotic-like serine/threonine-protein kinase